MDKRKWEAREYGSPKGRWYVKDCASGKTINYPLGKDEALLIGAAPDLFRELEQMVQHCLSCEGSGRVGIRRDIKCPICLGGRGALARSRGES